MTRTAVQLELSVERPGAPAPANFVEYITRRLPNTDFVTTADIASAFAFSTEWIRQLIEAGTFGEGCIKAPGLSSRWRVPRAAVLQYAARHADRSAS